MLNPGVQTQSVIATSIYSQLNCSIVDAAGQPVVAIDQQLDDRDLHPLATRSSSGRVRSSAGRACAANGRRTAATLLSPPVPETTRSTSSSWSASRYWACVIVSPNSRRAHSASRLRCLLLAVTAAAHLGDDELRVPGLRQRRPNHVDAFVGQAAGDLEIQLGRQGVGRRRSSPGLPARCSAWSAGGSSPAPTRTSTSRPPRRRPRVSRASRSSS